MKLKTSNHLEESSISESISFIVELILEKHKDINKKKVSKILEQYGNIHFIKTIDNDKKADFSECKKLKKDIGKLLDKGILKKRYLKILKKSAKNEALSD